MGDSTDETKPTGTLETTQEKLASGEWEQKTSPGAFGQEVSFILHEPRQSPESPAATTPEPPAAGAQWTLAEAARILGVARQSLFRMAKDGRLNVTVRPHDQVKVVDKAELLRVFGRLGPAASQPVGEAATTETATKLPAATQATSEAVLRAELAAVRDALARADQQLAEAREREAKLLEVVTATTRLLGHQATTSETTSGDSGNSLKVQEKTGFWGGLFGKGKG